MPDNRQNQSNVVSISSNVDNIQEGIWRMKLEKKEGSKEEDKEESIQYPDRPGEPDCIYYLRTGLCGYGSNCRFNHPPLSDKNSLDRSELPQREGQPDCGYYVKTGMCKYGPTCKYHHPLDRRGVAHVPLNNLGLPIRQEEKPCLYYLRTSTCKFGPSCKFDHPSPTAVEPVFPVPGPSTLPSWSLTRPSYLAPSQVSGPQTYMPLVFPPFQGPFATQSWNGYLGTNVVYNSKNQGDLLTTAAINHLPERPEQPECRYFMSNGSCKYGSNCKFHHPKERIAQLAMSNLGPHGLPLRPGEDICAYFSSYGICKFGPNCKFNHPFSGYFSSYYFGMHSIPQIMDRPFFPNQKNSAISNSSQPSQSRSLKITDWIQKPETVEEKNLQKSETKAVEQPHELVDDHPNDGPNSSELPGDQSD